MSSMRNAVQRRNHKERAQPREREKWGVLEKHKDYSLRAKDYNAKKTRLKILRQKAADRNPDEFYFGMYSSKTHDKGQKLADRGNTVLSHDAAKLLKTQDAGYLKTVAQQTRRAREKLEREYVLKDGKRAIVLGRALNAAEGQHIIFAQSTEEQKKTYPINSIKKQTHGEVSESHHSDDSIQDNDNFGSDDSRPAAAQIKSHKALIPEAAAQKQASALRKRRKRRYEAQLLRLKALQSREQDIVAAERELNLQRAKMSNSVGGVNKAGVKFKVRERKR
ncbi:MAG: hypothetical protein Q9191_000058 [Dirinaria sp. TL-2023a]